MKTKSEETSIIMKIFTFVWRKIPFKMQGKLTTILLVMKLVPMFFLAFLMWTQFIQLGEDLKEISVTDASIALTNDAIESIERMTTDTAYKVADFLYQRDADLMFLANLEPNAETYSSFINNKTGRLINQSTWTIALDGLSWEVLDENSSNITPSITGRGGISTNPENNDLDGFNYREPDNFSYRNVPIYDEIAFIDLDGNEIINIVADNSEKVNYPLNPELQNVSIKENTYVKAEDYWDKLVNLKENEIYVSDVIGAYVGSNYIGMYTPSFLESAAAARGYDIPFLPEEQGFSNQENPIGQRFEGIVRYATPIFKDGEKIGYLSLALNHDHIMEMVDKITPMNDRYNELNDAFEGNYAFIWDYECKSIAHPRHHSIVGYDPETGEPAVPWIAQNIYDEWQESGLENWTDYVYDYPTFDGQSRSISPATQLTQAGMVGLDGRWLNNAPQCTGWMDMSLDGGSGSFYILWSGLYKITTVAAIPYYTGQYAPSEDNGWSRRGFGVVTIGAGFDDFLEPVTEMEALLDEVTATSLETALAQISTTVFLLIIIVTIFALGIAHFITSNISTLIDGVTRFRNGERHFRFNSPIYDEFGLLAESFDDMAGSIVDSVNTPLSILDRNERIIYMNEQALAITGNTLEELIGKEYKNYSIYPCDSQYNPVKNLRDGKEQNIYYHEETDKYFKPNATYFINTNGQSGGYLVRSTDFTDMVKAQKETERQKALLDTIFTATPSLIWYKDIKGRYLTVNPQFASITTAPPSRFIGKTTSDMFDYDIVEILEPRDTEVLTTRMIDDVLTDVSTITFADGHEEILDVVRVPVFDSNGQKIGVLGYATDVTQRVKSEQTLKDIQVDLEEAVVSANRANSHKGEFLARMSHEIRTPMNAIIGMTALIIKALDEVSTDEVAEESLLEIDTKVHQIESSSQHLLGLINDILDISKIDEGKIELTDETTEMVKLASTVADIIRPRCTSKDINFICKFGTFEPSSFLCDSLRLRQVLINLLGNAVKFTPECGSIEFIIDRIDSKDGKSLIKFAVKDSGIGISEGAIEHIFNPFEQANSSITRKYGGTGLGLTISQRIVELFGGLITVESVVGRGSTFEFEIWLEETKADELVSEEELADMDGKFEGRRLLLVDDVDINRMIVTSLIEDTLIEVDEANDGVVAVKMFQESPVGTYDAILMDIQMPIMDGYEASSSIRGLDRPDSKIVPIIALSANAFKDDIDKALASGMNTHIAKPVETTILMTTLMKYIPIKKD